MWKNINTNSWDDDITGGWTVFKSESVKKIPKDIEYIIKSWETLSVLAQNKWLSLNDLLKLNPNIKDPNKINVWQKIVVWKQADWNYTVKPWDNLSQIAVDQWFDMEELLKYNPDIKNPDAINVWQEIKLDDRTTMPLPEVDNTLKPIEKVPDPKITEFDSNWEKKQNIPSIKDIILWWAKPTNAIDLYDTVKAWYNYLLNPETLQWVIDIWAKWYYNYLYSFTDGTAKNEMIDLSDWAPIWETFDITYNASTVNGAWENPFWHLWIVIDWISYAYDWQFKDWKSTVVSWEFSFNKDANEWTKILRQKLNSDTKAKIMNHLSNVKSNHDAWVEQYNQYKNNCADLIETVLEWTDHEISKAQLTSLPEVVFQQVLNEATWDNNFLKTTSLNLKYLPVNLVFELGSGTEDIKNWNKKLPNLKDAIDKFTPEFMKTDNLNF